MRAASPPPLGSSLFVQISMHLLPLILMLLLLASCQQPPPQEEGNHSRTDGGSGSSSMLLNERDVLTALEKIEINSVTEWPRVPEPPDLESLGYVVVHDDQVADGYIYDGYIYAAVLSREEPLFWIHRTGGFAGINEFYGPVSLADGEIVEVVDP